MVKRRKKERNGMGASCPYGPCSQESVFSYFSVTSESDEKILFQNVLSFECFFFSFLPLF